MSNRGSIVLNTLYALEFGAYWMIYAVVGSFASVFMLDKGYNNSEIGLTLALANVLALVIQPWIADYADRSGRHGIVIMCIALAGLIMIIGSGLFVFGGGGILLALTFVLSLALHTVVQPLLNALAFKMREGGANVSFSIGRAGGSAGFALLLAVLGAWVERKGVMVMPVCLELVCAFFIVMIVVTNTSFKSIAGSMPSVDTSAVSDEAAGDDEHITLGDFIKRNKTFFIMNLGVAALFYSNAVLSNYMAQISAGVNATTEDVGRILSVMGFLEIPTMLLFDKIVKRIKCSTLIKIGCLGFTSKIVICHFAKSVAVLMAAQAFQLVAFSLFMPSMVHYINEKMSRGESVKGQALYVMMITFSTIVASLLGGWMLDDYGVHALTLVAAIVTGGGALVVAATVDRV